MGSNFSQSKIFGIGRGRANASPEFDAAPPLTEDRRPTRNIIVLPKIERLQPVPFYLSVVAVVKNEAAYIEEWIDFHQLVGCSHFYVYNNNSSDETSDILKKYEQHGILTEIPWPDFMPWSSLIQKCYCHVPAYAHALSAFGKRSRWMMFIDIDEFVFPTKCDSLQDELRKYEDLPSLAIPWHMFGHSAHECRPGGLVIENYTMRAAIPPVSMSLAKYKSIVDPTHVKTPGVHRFILEEGPLVYTQGRTVLTAPNWQYLMPTPEDGIVLNHYYSRSKEEFNIKLGKSKAGQRSRADKRKSRVESIETVLVEDLRIQRFVPRLIDFRTYTKSR